MTKTYQEILTEVQQIAKKCGRDPGTIKVVAVSKKRSTEEILEVANQGCQDFGENRIPEALEKMQSLDQDLNWHFIGALQRKKVKSMVAHFDLIHSVDTPELAKEIAKRAEAIDQTQAVLLQVNTSGEEAKQGLGPDAWLEALPSIMNLPGLNVQGLMTMAPNTGDQNVIRRCFKGLKTFQNEIETLHKVKLPELSMGMSNDYSLAIEEGATILRIGSAIFSNAPEASI
jgi:pyridoxal phosphate enzyme (YggS family)